MMTCAYLRTVAVAILLGSVSADINEHLVEHLPGYVNADGTPKALPTKQYSGYIPVPVDANASAGSPAGTAYVHYWFVENAANDPDAPTLVWQQGGPGGSSLIGFFTENGPFTVNDASFKTSAFNRTGVPTLFDNPFSWYTAPANMLYVEHPAPTGFSYCEPASACNWDDENQAIVNYGFYVRFFAAYPEVAKNDFYMSGESYAGVLVPTVALQFLEHRNSSNSARAPWSLKGFVLGNDCPGNQIYTCTPYSGWRGVKVALDFRFGHGMIPERLYKKIYAVCSSWWSDEPFPSGADMFDAPPKPCADLLEDPVRPCMSVAGDTYDMGGGYFLYDTCSKDMLALSKVDHTPHPELFKRAPPATSDEYINSSGEYACGQEYGGNAYLNTKAVQAAIHVKPQQFSFSTGLQYNKTWGSLLPEYVSKLLPNYRIMQYSGDADPCVPYTGTQRWIDSLDLTISAPWRPWAPTGQAVAGYTQQYAGAGIHSSFTFTTIRDAGHMAPRYKPTEALHMVKHFLANQPL